MVRKRRFLENEQTMPGRVANQSGVLTPIPSILSGPIPPDIPQPSSPNIPIAPLYSPGASIPPFSSNTRLSEAPRVKESGKIIFDKFMGDLYVDCSGMDMQNVEVSTVLGSVEIRLHGCRLSKGLNRLIISGFMGEIVIFAPADLPIYSHSSSFAGSLEIFGKKSSGIGNNVDVQTSNYATADSKLYISTNHFVGAIKIITI